MQEITELKKQAGNFSLLVVLNDDSIKEEALSFLQTIFIKIELASDSSEALELFKQKKPDIVVTSLDFSSMNGLDFVQNLKKLNKFLPIIILSQTPDAKKLLELIHLGITDFIQTPINTELFKAAIIKAVDLSHFITCKPDNQQMSQKESPIEALKEVFQKHLDIQLISNYKGIPIIHTGKIVEIYKDIVQIQTRKIQTKAIEFNKKTILESEFLPNDIEATLVNIDHNNAEVSLSHLKYIEYTPKRRKYARLVPSEDMKLMAYKKGGAKLNVDLRDISLTNLTFEIKALPEFFKLGVILDLKIAFDVPENDLAYYVDKLYIINFQGKIIKIHEENATYFVSVEFEVPKIKEDVFNQYLYNRELALIKEFKRFASKKS
jgi:FixJ family two-component response regulator